MILGTHLISFVLGYLLIVLILRDLKKLPFPLILCLAAGIGLGASSLLTYISFLLINFYSPLLINGLHVLSLSMCFWFIRFKQYPLWPKEEIFTSYKTNRIFFWIHVVLWSFLIGHTYFISQAHPFGEWDAWSMWNMKAKFMIFAGENWKDVFNKIDPQMHPDYPMLLPCLNIWHTTQLPAYWNQTPAITGVLFTVLTGALMYWGLKPVTGNIIATLVSTLLLTNAFFVFWATSQYADILLAFYLLAIVIVLFQALKQKDSRLMLLTGLLLGFLTFVKNEGLSMSMMLVVLIGLYGGVQILRKDFNPRLLGHLLGGMFLTAWSTVLFKLFLAPPNPDILPNLVFDFSFIGTERWDFICTKIIGETIKDGWGYIWPFIFLLILLRLPKFFIRENLIMTLFFIFHILIVIFLYAATPQVDINWWLPTSIRRLFLQLLPAVLFFVFYVLWMNSPQKQTQSRIDQNVYIVGIPMAIALGYTFIRSGTIGLSHDEAITATYHVSSPFWKIVTFGQIFPANNHMLATVLMKISTLIFGTSEITLRLPLVIAHGFYLAGLYKLLGLFMKRSTLVLGVILLGLNPFLLDFFSCARGYALGWTFLIWSFYFLLKYIRDDARKIFNLTSCFWLMALAVCAHLSFLHLFMTMIAFVGLWELWNLFSKKMETFKDVLWRLFLSIGLSSFALLLLFKKPIKIMRESKMDFTWGGDTSFWADTVGSLIESILYGQSYSSFALGLHIFVAMILLSVGGWLIYQLIIQKSKEPLDYFMLTIYSLILLCAGIITLQFLLLETKFIIGRTAAFFIILFFMLFILLCQRLQTLEQPILKNLGHGFLIVVVALSLIHFMRSANLSSFYEWRYDSQTKQMIKDLISIENAKGHKDPSVKLGINWLMEPTVNFYRDLYKLNWLEKTNRRGPLGSFDYYYLVSPENSTVDKAFALQSLVALQKGNLKTIKFYPKSNTLLATP